MAKSQMGMWGSVFLGLRLWVAPGLSCIILFLSKSLSQLLPLICYTLPPGRHTGSFLS